MYLISASLFPFRASAIKLVSFCNINARCALVTRARFVSRISGTTGGKVPQEDRHCVTHEMPKRERCGSTKARRLDKITRINTLGLEVCVLIL